MTERDKGKKYLDNFLMPWSKWALWFGFCFAFPLSRNETSCVECQAVHDRILESVAKHSSLLRYRASNHGWTPRTPWLLSASFPTELCFVPFYRAVAMTEYGNMFKVFYTKPCDKAYPLDCLNRNLRVEKRNQF